MQNKRIVLAAHPNPDVTPSCFALDEVPVPDLNPGDVLVRNIYLSCDPYMRGRMLPSRTYADPFAIGEVIPARVVGQVHESRNPQFPVGCFVWSFLGWEQYTRVANGQNLNQIDDSIRPLSHAISIMGMPGLTAWVGMMRIAQPQPGETVFVSAASGAVGQIAGQLARLAGARVVGSVGSEHKRQHLLERLNFDAAFNYRESGYESELDRACPNGIDVYFENVGGVALEAVLPRLTIGARIPVCGMISRPGGSTLAGIRGIECLISKRAEMTGFLVYDHMHHMPRYLQQMGRLMAAEKIVYFEDIIDGLENTPGAFIEMLCGKNVGKRLVRISDDPNLGTD